MEVFIAVLYILFRTGAAKSQEQAQPTAAPRLPGCGLSGVDLRTKGDKSRFYSFTE